MRNNDTDITRLPLVSSGWEPCARFVAEAAASPVCAGCGWLAPEHEAELPLAS
jgi:hypothetical protein